MTNSIRKGKAGEREAAKALLQHLGWDAYRSAQVSGKMSSDLLGVPARIHPEVKRVHRIGALRFMEQARRDAKKDQIPVVFMREDEDKHWYVMLPLDRMKEFADGINDSNISSPRTVSKMWEPEQPRQI